MLTRSEPGDIDPAPEIAGAKRRADCLRAALLPSSRRGVAVKQVSPPVVETKGSTKRYASRAGVDALNMQIPPTVVAGLIGPNGAGKTTTLRMRLGPVRPTAPWGTRP